MLDGTSHSEKTHTGKRVGKNLILTVWWAAFTRP